MPRRNGLLSFWAAIAALGCAFSAVAAETVKVENAWVRAPAPGQNTAVAYADLTSQRNAAIVAAGSPVAARVEMHSMTTEGGVMRMRALPRIDLPAGTPVKLGAGGTHLMLVDLKRPLKPGDKVPLTLSVQPTGPTAGTSLTTLTLELEVKPAAASAHNH